jgi:phosphoglycerate kinase
MNFNRIDNLNCDGKTVLIRVDLNVPMQNGKVTNTNRIDRVLPTINDILAKNGKIIVISHFGRPKGEKNFDYSLEPVAKKLSQIIGKPVTFINDCIGDEVKSEISKMQNQDIMMLENLRFYKGEEENSKDFARELASLADFYINDAFSSAHRAHASTHKIAQIMTPYAGRLMEAEINALSSALDNPKKPIAAIVGGAKISTKIALLENLIEKTDYLVLGGGMANTFLAAKGYNLGKSLMEKDMLDLANKIMDKAEQLSCEIILPIDGLMAKEFKENAENREIDISNISNDEMMLDIGSKSAKYISDELSNCKTIIWNGPLGAFEIKPFDSGTVEVANNLANFVKENGIISVAGGGDTVSALSNTNAINDFSYISTAGGAFLEWMEGKTLPAVKALYDGYIEDKQSKAS